jgi:fructose-1,6-bisphosphatase/inositol monophosphatase family enzyme
MRRPGAAALDLAWVACGRMDGFWELGLSPWDMAAGSLLITEAGGLVGDLSGEAELHEDRQHRRRQPEDIFASCCNSSRRT